MRWLTFTYVPHRDAALKWGTGRFRKNPKISFVLLSIVGSVSFNYHGTNKTLSQTGWGGAGTVYGKISGRGLAPNRAAAAASAAVWAFATGPRARVCWLFVLRARL
jgi:hypothetical protein